MYVQPISEKMRPFFSLFFFLFSPCFLLFTKKLVPKFPATRFVSAGGPGRENMFRARAQTLTAS
jgi:hypothetical protein